MRSLLWLAGVGALAAASLPRSLAAQASAAQLHLSVDSARREVVLSLGPVDLPARTSHHDLVQPPVHTAVLPITANLYGFRVELADGNGRPVAREVLHHLNVIQPDRRELFLPISRRLLAAGKETSDEQLPHWLLGVPVQRGERLVLSAMLHNPTETAYHDVELRVLFAYTEERSLWPLFKVHPFQLDVMFPVGDKSFDLPPGRSERAFEARPARAGRILAIGGHLHEFGRSLRLEDATTGDIIWEASPIEDERGTVLGMPVGRLWWRLGVRIDPSHVYRVTAVYDNPTADTIYDGGMGVVGGIFLAADGEAWPQADPEDPLYVRDLRHALRLDEKAEPASPHRDHHDHGPRPPAPSAPSRP